VLIGPNGSGKTNILNAIRLLQLTSESRPRTGRIERISAPCQIQVRFSYGRFSIGYRASIHLTSSADNSDEIVSAREEWSVDEGGAFKKWHEIPGFLLSRSYGPGSLFRMHRSRDGVLHRIGRVWPMTPAKQEMLLAAAEFKQSIKYYSASRFTDPSKCPSSFETEGNNQPVESYSTRGPHFSFVTGLYVLSRTDRPLYNSFFNIVGREGIGLLDDIEWRRIPLSSSTVDVKTGGKIERKKKNRVLVVPVLKVRRSLVSFSQLSEGTFRALALIYYLMTAKSGMLLVEEPEVCIHHGLLRSLMEALKAHAHTKQIVLSTHSELVLDSVLPENVFPVRNTANKGTTVLPLSKSMSGRDFNALKEYLASSGNLGEYWSHGGTTV
jgi:ABC-type transport system involved in cytochrome c biogenesis ATPase subunit